MLSPKTRRNISRILPFGVIWLLFSIIYVLIEKGLIGDLDYYPSTKNEYSFTDNLLITTALAFISGIIVGFAEIMYFSRLFKKSTFGQKLFYKTLIYVGVMVSFLLINTVISNSIRLEVNIFHPDLWNSVFAFINNFAFTSVLIYIAAIIFLSLFYAEVSQNLGPGVLSNFFFGRYHTPIEEERIFMFLDMKSSTTLAERLGHVRYFEMLKEYYADISGPIVDHLGEIYQYVGDEMVVSWKMDNGIKNNNCIKCFYAMKERLQRQGKKYENKYGFCPTFKAGLHFGAVTTGEIGVLKRDITFTGDVLNTTSRIQGLCNENDVDLLVSSDLSQKLSYAQDFETKEIGWTELKGKNQKVQLLTVLPTA